ncbi:guanyl-nucleotide exchange factor [Lithospermum erythrorhizon]|uniref:Guanyl-nucleotide exchange factor n=1 Tax=Lithospermum erythrorhizon TaxID=34254 RepID=A0AAV3NKB3_LITER
MGDNTNEPFLNKKKHFSRSISHAYDELHSFRSCLKWMCVDQSSPWRTCISWTVFIIFAIIVPCLSHFVLACSGCDSRHNRPYDSIVQLSLTALASLSFLCLSRFVKIYGLRRFLFFDRLCDESETVRAGYTGQLHRSLQILFIFVTPCFTLESVYKIWWYATIGTGIPFASNIIVSDVVACSFELLSWLYRTIVFFLVCVLFRLICYLQILRLQDFGKVFQTESDVEAVLREHLRIRRHLRIISHRYRAFILFALIFVTASQFSSLLMTTRQTADLNLYKSGELALCSVSLLAGLMILLRSATKITHKAQAVTCLATKWHVCATVDSFDSAEVETPVARRTSGDHIFPIAEGSSDNDVGDEEDELDNSNFIPSYAYSTISFQKRQALVTYFENNKAGVTLYGFMLDRDRRASFGSNMVTADSSKTGEQFIQFLCIFLFYVSLYCLLVHNRIISESWFCDLVVTVYYSS